MRLRFVLPALALAAAASTLPARDAAACGGCIPQTESTVVTGHRMVLSISTDQTVLWDQIKYSGNPAEFAWILPVHAGAIIETATDAWFETLDAATTTTVISPTPSCGSSGFGCGASTSLADRGANGGGGVTVLHEGTVGPYETVTLKSSQPGALNQWLTDHKFNVSPSTQPILDAYTQEGFDFIALRLQPGQGVREMKPVRVVTQGMSNVLPLRMVAAGTGPEVSIVLFTISEARYAAENFANVSVPQGLVVWDFDHQTSTYDTVRSEALSLSGGASWLTTYAQPRPFFSQRTPEAQGFPLTFTASDGFSPLSTLAEAYVDRGVANGESSDSSCTAVYTQLGESAAKVVNPCPFGAKPDDPMCGTAGIGQVDSRTLACGALDDLAVAMRGLHLHDVWLTRLEANLPRAALSKDLQLKPLAEDPKQASPEKALSVDNFIAANGSVGDPCPSVPPTSGGSKPRPGSVWGVFLVAMGALALMRRTSRQRLA